ncbi:MAG: hypothetical protein M1358_07750 [Chloroflexi bacterium]|nr:hypothetical protein [Chloroflexota bacterium]
MLGGQKTRRRDSRRAWTLWREMIVAAIVIIGGAFLLFPRQNSTQQKPQGHAAAANTSSGNIVQDRLSHQTLDLGKDNTTWQPDADNLPGVIAALHLPPSDPPTLHHHVHLDIYISGHKIVVPKNIGLSREAEVPVHTHDPSGIVHIETVDTSFKPTLGLLFDVWGVFFNGNNIGGYTTDASNQLAAYVNGRQYPGNPRNIALDQHDEIAVAFGEDSQLPQPIPSTSEFPNGL